MREICISATVNLPKGMIGNRKIESLDACLGFFFSLSCSQASTFLLVSFFFFFPFVSSRRTQRNLVSEHYIIVTFRVSETAEELTRYAALVLACSTFHLRLSCSLSLDYLPFFVVCLFPRVATDTFFAACTTAPELQSSAVLLFFFFLSVLIPSTFPFFLGCFFFFVRDFRKGKDLFCCCSPIKTEREESLQY